MMGKVIRHRFGKPCQECDGIVPAARIRVQPRARLCVECQELAEKKKARSVSLAIRVAKANDTIIVRG